MRRENRLLPTNTMRTNRSKLNLLAPIDQASFLGWEALGRAPLVQVIWTFGREFEKIEVERFSERLNKTMLGRCVRKSFVPFGRHCWVRSRTSLGPTISKDALTKRELIALADNVTAAPINPEQGPGWLLTGAPMDKGESALVLTASHCLVDGLAMVLAVGDAVQNNHKIDRLAGLSSGLSPRILLQDAIVAIHSLAGIPRALRAGLRILTNARTNTQKKKTTIPIQRAEERSERSCIEVPFLSIAIPEKNWKERCRQLSGSTRALQAAVAARLAVKVGRVDQYGKISLVIPVSTRKEEDKRANALQAIRFDWIPSDAGNSLRGLSQKIKTQLKKLKQDLDDLEKVLELTPYIPSPAIKWIESSIHGGRSTVTVSALGNLDDKATRPLGDAAKSITIRLLEPIQYHDLQNVGGTMYCLSWSTSEHQYISFRVWQPGVLESNEELASVVKFVMQEFGLNGTDTLGMP